MARTKPAVIVLAAGKGTRMKSSKPKVLHEVGGLPLVAWPVGLAKKLQAHPTVVVVGHAADEVSEAVSARFDGVSFALQAEQRGTGHAVMEGMKKLKRFSGPVVILSGDVPRLRVQTVRAMLSAMRRSKAKIVALSMRLDDPTGYGRIVRDDAGRPTGIVEHKDADEATRAIDEVNAGVYCADAAFLRRALKRLGTSNAQGEYYLTDVLAMAAPDAAAVLVDDPTEVLGANDRAQLSGLDRLVRAEINHALMVSGVTMIDPSTTYVDAGVKVGRDTTIHPGVHLRGATKIGKGCTVDAGCVITDGTIGDEVVVRPYSIIESAVVKKAAIIGPFARLRPGATIMPEAHVGNFVELKKTTLGKGAKANHLAYLGDAVIGAGSNVGAGTITCNYDGYGKYLTEIGRNVFVGSNATLVAPVSLGNGAYVAAGSTVTADAEPNDLALGRARQVNKSGRAKAVRKAAQERAAAKKKSR